VQIFIGTPGRLYNLINLGILKVQLFESFVLDEVDILLEKNFKWNIYNIYRFIPDKSQIIAVSSSLNNTIIGVARGFMKNAVKFFVRREEMIPNVIFLNNSVFYIIIFHCYWRIIKYIFY
jgi:superfamily II DNA/RNA helicase